MAAKMAFLDGMKGRMKSKGDFAQDKIPFLVVPERPEPAATCRIFS